jgi:hypothetical protein
MMRMKKASLVLSLVLVFSLFSFLSNAKASGNNEIKVGVFYYPWYFGGNGTGHWNGNATEADPSLPSTWWTVVDRPVSDWYASNDPEVIRQHLDWFAYAHIDFGIVSWWGPYHHVWYDDDWVKAVFDETRNYAPWFRWVISIEDCGRPENWTFFRNWVYENYTEKFSDIWLNDTDKNEPFLFWMNGKIPDDNATRESIAKDSDFSVRILGQSYYVNWTTWTPYTYGGATSAFPPSLNEFMCVMPRYDETRLDPTGIKDKIRNSCADRYLNGSDWENVEPLNEPLYDYQWKEVLSNASAGKIRYVGIATWNDFTERTQIEPCYDNTSAHRDNATYLFNQTKYYIDELKQTVPEFPTFIAIPIFLIVALVAIIVYKKRLHVPRER